LVTLITDAGVVVNFDLLIWNLTGIAFAGDWVAPSAEDGLDPS